MKINLLKFFLQFIAIVAIFMVLSFVEKSTIDRFHGSSMDKWIEECREANIGKDIVFPDRPHCMP